jgi:hypothetical protein
MQLSPHHDGTRFRGQFQHIPLTGFFPEGGDHPGEVTPPERFILPNGQRRTTRQELDDIRDSLMDGVKDGMEFRIEVDEDEKTREVWARITTNPGNPAPPPDSRDVNALDTRLEQELKSRRIPFNYLA